MNSENPWVLGLGAVQAPLGTFSSWTRWKRKNICHCQGGKCFECVDNQQADVKIPFINLENNEKQGRILYFVVSPCPCFLRNAIDVL